MIEMINTLNVDNKVGKVMIKVDSCVNEWNSEIVRLILDRYTNVYDIVVDDFNQSVDDWMHDWIKQYV